jgi:hypothetical protein
MSDLIQITLDVNSNADQATKSLDRLQGSIVNNLKTAERLERGYRTLDRALNKGLITAQQYAKGIQQVDAAIDQVINGTQQAAKATNGLSNSMSRAAGNMNQFGKTSVIGGKNLNRTNMMVQQAGYQFQDFAVQIQGGTNAFVALGQQGSQLLGIFGAKGAVLGAILAIGTAFANVASSGKQLTVDFKQLGKDMAGAFAPLMPVFTAIGNAFKFIGGLAIDSINLIINGIAKLVTVITYIPSIVLEVFDRAWLYMKIFGNNVAILVNEIKFNFMMGLTSIAQDFAAFVSSTAGVLNDTFNLNLSTDIGSGLLDSLNDSLRETNDTYSDLLVTNQELEKSVGGPIKSYEELQGALEGLTGVDLRDYFKLVAKASKDTGKATKETEEAAKKLREELESPLVNAIGSVSNAFGDFISRGLTDFKGFVQQVLGSFQSMISQMIAMAVRNRIMLSLGVGGITPAAAQAGQVAGLGSAGGMLGSLGTGAGISGIAGGTGLLGGAGNAVSGLGGGGAGFFSVGANAAAAGGGAMATIGAAIPVIGAVALAIGFLRKKTKELDSGLNVTVKNMDALVTSFKTVETSRFFGLSKKTSTSTGGVSNEVSDPIVAAVTQIQQSVLDAAAAFGIGSDAFDNFSYEFKLSLKGLSEDQQMQKINEELAKMGDSFASLSGHFETMNELLEAANQRMQLQNRLDQLLGNNQAILTRQREAELAAMNKLNRPLAQAIYDLEDAQAAVVETQAAVANAFTALRASIDAEKDRIQNSFTGIIDGIKERLDVVNEALQQSRSIYDLLANALRSRQVSGDAAFAGRRSAAQSFLSAGDFRDEEQLREALSVVAEPSEGLFSSFVDYARDFGRTSFLIEEAKKIAEVQLTADEKQVLLLEEQIVSAEASRDAQLEALEQQYQIEVNQYNALLGIDTSIKSVTEAIGTLRGAIAAMASAQAAAKAAGAAASAASAAKVADTPKGTAAAAVDYQLVKEGKYYVQRFSDGDYFRTGHRNQDLAAQAAKTNATLKAAQAPAFAMGGYHTGGVRMVGESGPELEATGPSRIFSHNQTASMFKDPDLKDAVRSLKEEVAGLRSEQRQIQMDISKYTKRTYDIERKWDVEGLPATRT